MVFKRYCEDCGKIYQPSGKYTRFCEECRGKRLKLAHEKMRKNYGKRN